MVKIKIARVPNLADWWPDPLPSRDHFPSWIKDLRREKLQTKKLNMSDCLPAVEAILQGLMIRFPVDMTFEYLGTHPKWGKLVKCDHTGYPLIGGHDASQYKNAEFQDFHVVKIGLPWIIEAPKGYSCLFTQPLNRSGRREAFCISGLVRCDNYYNMISIPYAIALKEIGDSITVRKGDPLVQVIPVKREGIDVINSEINLERLQNTIDKIDEIPNFYKTLSKTS